MASTTSNTDYLFRVNYLETYCLPPASKKLEEGISGLSGDFDTISMKKETAFCADKKVMFVRCAAFKKISAHSELRGSHIHVLVYDVSDPNSFDAVRKFNRFIGEAAHKILVGRLDLGERKIAEREGEEFARTIDCPVFMEINGENKEDLQKLDCTIFERCLKKYSALESPSMTALASPVVKADGKLRFNWPKFHFPKIDFSRRPYHASLFLIGVIAGVILTKLAEAYFKRVI